MGTLFEISADMRALDELIAESDMDSPEVQALIIAWAEENEIALEKKVDNYAALIKEMEARASMRREESKRIGDRAMVDESNARALKERLFFFFQSKGIRKLETPRFQVGIAKNGGVTPLEVDPLQIGKLPEECKKISVEPDNAEIRKRLESGEQLPGCRLLERGESLRIR